MYTKLTKKEIAVFKFLAKGKLNKEISQELTIALDTVKKHTTNIYKKIEVRNRSEAILWYMNNHNDN